MQHILKNKLHFNEIDISSISKKGIFLKLVKNLAYNLNIKMA